MTPMTRRLTTTLTTTLATLTAAPAYAADEQLMPYEFLCVGAMFVYFGIMFSIWFVAKRWKQIEAAQDRKREARMADLASPTAASPPAPSPGDPERG